MDLGNCPRCGKKWPGGEFCPSCGFIPIGAGLTRLPKKKRKKLKPYREPGGMTPVLVTLAIIGGIGSVYRSKPWEDGWDKVRALFGNPRIHDIQGNWDVEKLLQVSPSASGPFLTAHVNEATLTFTDDVVTFRLEIQGAEIDLKGTYEVDGTTVHVKGLKSGDANPPPIPSNIDLKLAWNGEDEVVASTSDDEEAFLHREPSQQFVTMRSDRITTSYSSNENDGRGMISKPAGGQ